MNVFPGLLERWRRYRYQRIMKRLRENSAALGFPLDHLTDEEVASRLTALGVALRSFGITTEQAITTFHNLRTALRELENETSEESPPPRGQTQALRRTQEDEQDRPEGEP